MKTKTIILTLITILIIITIGYLIITDLFNTVPDKISIIKVNLGDETFDLETAITHEEKIQGLMFVENMPRNNGMIFIYGGEGERFFWMKNTLIPLDMIFINFNKEIVEIKKNIQPCMEDPCEKYQSTTPAMHVIEINAGLSDELELSIGDKIDLNI